MKFDPNNIPPGLSWGTRGFRVGKGASGRWWMSLSLLGFRYYWYLSKNHEPTQHNLINSSNETEKKVTFSKDEITSTKTNFATKSTSKIKKN